MNKKLKFSWGHIIAFVALIFIAYTTFVGLTYMNKGNFTIAGILTAGIVFLLLLFFMAVQQLKGCDEHYDRKIIWERILFCAAPLLFIALMIPYAHTWKVQKNNDEIVTQFNEAIKSSRQMFTDYETYADNRIQAFDMAMKTVIVNKDSLNEKYQDFGFTPGLEMTQKRNRTDVLRIQLLPSDYDSLKVMANNWIDKANQGANVWNVFLLGNIKEISSAIEKWHEQLASFSTKHTLEGESLLEGNIKPFDENRESIQKALDGLENLSDIYTEKGWPSLWGWLTGALCFIMLLFPWYIQKRNTNNPYRLIGYQRWYKNGSKPKKQDDGKVKDEVDPVIIDTGI